MHARGVDFINGHCGIPWESDLWYQNLISIENTSIDMLYISSNHRLYIPLLHIIYVATNGSDYSSLPAVISISAGHPLNTPFCANITIIDDNTLENTESFSVALYTDFPEGVILTRDRSIVEIIDNEEGIDCSKIVTQLGHTSSREYWNSSCK